MTWLWGLLLGSTLLTGFPSKATATSYNVEAGTKYKILGQSDRERLSASSQLARGRLETSFLKNKFELRLYTGLLSMGPITEAFMTSWSHPIPDEVPIMPFIKKLSSLQGVSFDLSGAQAGHLVDGDWMVVVRSSGYVAAQYTGRITACEGNGDARQCEVEISRAGTGTVTDEPNGEAEMFSFPFVPSLRNDRATGRLCLRVKFNWNSNERPLVSVDFSLPGGGAASRAVIGQPDPSREFVDACAPAGRALAEAFSAGHVQITVATGAAPGREYVSRFVFINKLSDRPFFGRHPFSPLPDLH